jgi:hypothetical protein
MAGMARHENEPARAIAQDEDEGLTRNGKLAVVFF